MRILKVSLGYILALVVTTSIARSEDDAVFESKIQAECTNLRQIYLQKTMTGASGGMIRFYVPIKDESGKSYYLNCERFGLPAMNEQDFETKKSNGTLLECIKSRADESDQFQQFKESLDSLISEAKSQEYLKTTKNSCEKDLGCNVLRSIANIGTMGLWGITTTALSIKKQDQKSGSNTCFGYNKSDCFTELATGIVKAFVSQVATVINFVANGVTSIGNGIGKIVHWFSRSDINQAETQESEMLHLVSQLDSKTVDEAEKDPRRFHTKVWDIFTKRMYQVFAEHLSCRQYEGTRLWGECNDARAAWSHSNCNQKMNTLCSLSGDLASTFVAGIVTGGALWVRGFANTGKALTLANAGLTRFGVFESAPLVVPKNVLDRLDLSYVDELAKKQDAE